MRPCWRGVYAKRENIQAWAKPYETNVTADRYIVQPPDELELRCAQVPEVNMQRQRVRPDGKISFEVLGDFDVAGKTPEEISVDVGKRIKEHYTLEEEHAVDVRVAVFASHVYYVMGQVSRPGPRNYTGRDSTLTAIAEAMPNSLAWQRRDPGGPAGGPGGHRAAGLLGWISRRWPPREIRTKDVLLQEGDIVYVPPTVACGPRAGDRGIHLAGRPGLLRSVPRPEPARIVSRLLPWRRLRRRPLA